MAIDPFFTGLIGAGISSAASLYSSKKSYEYARELSREQMAFQERMSNTAHQREVADLKAAGLNPILSVNSGASTPPGSAITGHMSDLGDATTRGFSAGSNAAIQKKQLALQQDMTEAEIRAKNASSAKDMELVENMKVLRPLIGESYTASADQARANASNLRAQIPKIAADIKRQLAETDKAVKYLAVADSEIERNKADSSLRYAQAANIRLLTQISSLYDLPVAELINNLFASEPGQLLTKRGAEIINKVFNGILSFFEDSKGAYSPFKMLSDNPKLFFELFGNPEAF